MCTSITILMLLTTYNITMHSWYLLRFRVGHYSSTHPDIIMVCFVPCKSPVPGFFIRLASTRFPDGYSTGGWVCVRLRAAGPNPRLFFCERGVTKTPSLPSRRVSQHRKYKVHFELNIYIYQLYFRTGWMRSQRRSQFKHDFCRGTDRATQITVGFTRQATGSLAHIVGGAWTSPNRCPNGHESAVRVQA